MATEYPDDYPSLVPDLRAALSRAEQERDEARGLLRRFLDLYAAEPGSRKYEDWKLELDELEADAEAALSGGTGEQK